MKTAIVTLVVVLGLVSVLIHPANAQANGASKDTLIAIDILLQPDQAMISKANAVNTLLRGNYPGGYSLDATHAPHVTLLQRFVRVKDLDAVTAAVAKVYAAQSPIGFATEIRESRLCPLGRSGGDGLCRRAHARFDAVP
jgi:hypothetical protein